MLNGSAKDGAGGAGAAPVLEARGLVKEFPGVRALDGAALRCRAGEVRALVGENGAGKSTIVRILTGNDRPDAGELLLDGEPVTLGDPREALARGITAVYQELTVLPAMSVLDNVMLGQEPTRRGTLRSGERRRRAREGGGERPEAGGDRAAEEGAVRAHGVDGEGRAGVDDHGPSAEALPRGERGGETVGARRGRRRIGMTHRERPGSVAPPGRGDAGGRQRARPGVSRGGDDAHAVTRQAAGRGPGKRGGVGRARRGDADGGGEGAVAPHRAEGGAGVADVDDPGDDVRAVGGGAHCSMMTVRVRTRPLRRNLTSKRPPFGFRFA